MPAESVYGREAGWRERLTRGAPLAGLLNVVPYVGSIVGALLPALLALTISPVKTLLVLVLFVIPNQIDGYVIQPMVMGHGVRMHPVVGLLAFLILAGPTLVSLTTIADEMLPREAPRKSATPRTTRKNYDSVPS